MRVTLIIVMLLAKGLMGKPTGLLKRKYLLVAALLLVVGVVTVFGDKGIYDLYKVGLERDGILAYNRTLETENRELERQIRLLETDRKYIGQIARKELGKLGRDELVYRIEEPSGTDKAPASK